MDKCKDLEMYWMNVDLWTWVLWVLCSLGISTLKHIQYVWERLDRAVVTNDWFSMFLDTKVYHLDATISNHKALLI